MQTECTQQTFEFQALDRREVVARFDGGKITSDAGGLLLMEVERRTGIIRQLAACFTDHRDEELIEHSVEELLKQRIFALALGYEDLNDHDQLREDPLLATLVGKREPAGNNRLRKRDQGKALAGRNTLNRLELTPRGANAASRYKKIVADSGRIESLFVDVFVRLHRTPPRRIVLDVDATDDPLHGDQLGKFFHGYYKSYCYLPLYIFCGDHLLCAKLRPSDIDAAAGTVKQLDRIVGHVRRDWPEVQIVIRGDSGFCRENIMAWCEANGVDYILGLAKNKRLQRILGKELEEAKQQFEATGHAARVFKDFTYRTHKSWSRSRRVIGKAEHLRKGANPRFVVTSLSAEQFDARTVYEDEYCGRGEMENRIKEQQLYLFADRTSAHSMRANQLRLWFSSVAYTLLEVIREFGLKGTEFARARCDTIRLRLLKIGASVRITVRRVWISMAESCPYQQLFASVYANLRRWLPQLVPR
jgi:hypothetical protein